MNLPAARRVRGFLALAFLAWAGPIAAQQTYPTRSTCETQGEWRPGEIALSTYLDSALVATALRPSWNPEWERVVATIYAPPDTLDPPQRVWVGAQASETEGMERIGQWLLHARNATPLPRGSRISMVIGDGGEFGFHGAELMACEPLLATREQLTQAMTDLGRRFVHMFRGRQLGSARVMILAHVDSDGDVTEVRIRERSPLPRIDDEVAEAFRQHAKFDPARVEGIARSVWIAMPVTVRPRGPGR